MDFTNTIIGSLNFALICIRFLAWPVIALGYPLLASIRAVESGSKYEMRKLVVYWTFFSLISLFEFGFDKIIQWMIPLWYSIRVVLVLWLVMGGFDGASHAYQTLVSPLLLSLNVDMKPNASEKFMPSKMECNDCKGDIQVVEAEEKNAALKESKTATVKERTPSESRPPQQEWRCDLCKVSTTSEKTLNHHLQGNKHKSKCESLRAAKTRPECKVSTISEKTSNHHLQGNKHKSKCESLKTSKQRCPETQQEWSCDLCKVRTTSEKTLNEHFQGSKHKSKLSSNINMVSHVKRKRHSSNIKEMANPSS